MTEGVDLHDDLCRFQILLKVPYRNISDPRVNYLINEENDWEWYHDVAAREIIQSIGRAVRSADDYATYYVLDSKFDQAMKGRTPGWLEEAIVR
jgi:Rad3-related DNA helicase